MGGGRAGRTRRNRERRKRNRERRRAESETLTKQLEVVTDEDQRAKIMAQLRVLQGGWGHGRYWARPH